MKLIIDIPEEAYNYIKANGARIPYYKLTNAIKNGIPLDKIRAEIEGNMESIIGKYDSSIPKSNMPSYKIERNKAREECISIIDKYRNEVSEE